MYYSFDTFLNFILQVHKVSLLFHFLCSPSLHIPINLAGAIPAMMKLKMEFNLQMPLDIFGNVYWLRMRA